MYKEHPVFEKPEDENLKIWRYLDFTKFVSMISTHALFFSRIDKIGDPFEGSITKANVDFSIKSAELLFQNKPKNFKEILKKARKSIQPLRKSLRKCTAVNCWHLNEFESAAMWKLYLKSDEGVAVQSTFKRLTRSFDVL